MFDAPIINNNKKNYRSIINHILLNNNCKILQKIYTNDNVINEL